MTGRILAVDPGSVRIGIALSDPTRTIASPLMVIKHISLEKDCQSIARLCQEHNASLVIIGQALGGEGEMTAQSRHTQKVADTLSSLIPVPVELWDESGSTVQARQIKQEMGVNRKKRAGHLDAQAAAVILQSYLDTQQLRRSDEPEKK
jgi:putative Holliday junction resolvase